MKEYQNLIGIMMLLTLSGCETKPEINELGLIK